LRHIRSAIERSGAAIASSLTACGDLVLRAETPRALAHERVDLDVAAGRVCQLSERFCWAGRLLCSPLQHHANHARTASAAFGRQLVLVPLVP
jgi:hypothetical protein